MSNDPVLTVRAARKGDLGGALALVEGASATTRWLDRVPEMVDDGICAGSDEYRACIAECGDECVGVGVYGSVAGCVGTDAIYAVIVADIPRDVEIGRAIVTLVVQEERSRGSRLLVAEVPGHSELGSYRSMLESAGLVQESRIEDYCRDGVALMQYRLELT